MAIVWPIGLWMNEFRDQLQARTFFVNNPFIEVAASPIKRDEIPDEYVVVIDVLGEEEAVALGQRRRDNDDVVECELQVAYGGEGEATAEEARTRALEIYAEVSQSVRDQAAVNAVNATAGQQMLLCEQITRKEMRQRLYTDGRRVLILFDVTVTSRTPPSP